MSAANPPTTQVTPPTDEDPGEPTELDQLSHLIFGVSRSEINQLHRRVEDKSEFTEHVSDSLAVAVQKAADDDQFKASMGPVVADGVLATARREPVKLGDAIAPALGPAIRGMVALALAKLNQRIEARIQTSFSIQGLKWRIEAMRTGVPLFDLVLRDTTLYRVDHVLLIHQETGTLLEHAAQPDLAGKDPAVVSAMLTAVRDFVIDAFDSRDRASEPQSYSIGDLTALVDGIGDLALVAVVRGTAGARLREQLRETLERLCVMFGDVAHAFDGNVSPFSTAAPFLEECLVEEAKNKKSEGSSKGNTKRVVAFVVVLGLLGGVGYAWYRNSQEAARWGRFESELQQAPGFVLLDVLEGEPPTVVGLVDPLASPPQAIAERNRYGGDALVWNLRPYISLEPTIVERRMEETLDPPETASLDLRGGRLTISGSAPRPWIRRVHVLRPVLSGVREVNLDRLRDSTEERWHSLKGLVEQSTIVFEPGEVTVAPSSAETVERLGETLRELDAELVQYGSRLRVTVVVDPRAVSRRPVDDQRRSEARVRELSRVVRVPLTLTRVEVATQPPDTNARPYAKLSVAWGVDR